MIQSIEPPTPPSTLALRAEPAMLHLTRKMATDLRRLARAEANQTCSLAAELLWLAVVAKLQALLDRDTIGPVDVLDLEGGTLLLDADGTPWSVRREPNDEILLTLFGSNYAFHVVRDGDGVRTHAEEPDSTPRLPLRVLGVLA